MEPEACFDIIGREPVAGGRSSLVKEKLRVAVRTAAGEVREQTLLLKRTSSTEAEALRAVNRVAGATAFPPLIRSGQDERGHWVAIPFYEGRPAETEAAIPGNVADSLAAMHAHYLEACPLAEPTIVDAAWWSDACVQHKVERLAAAGRPALRPIVETVRSWADHPAIRDTLARHPRTLLHGDVHRNNVIVANGTGRLVDWESGMYGMPQLDLITLGRPGYERYATTWRALTGQETAAPEWRRGYLAATVCVQLTYLARGARVSGDAHAQRMLDTATNALTELERITSLRS